MSETNAADLTQSNSAALAAPGAITLNGKTLYLSPLTTADFAELRERLREMALASVQTPLQALAVDFEKLPAAMRAMAMNEAIAQASGSKKAEPTKEAIAALAGTLDGVRLSLFLSARKLHPGLTREMATEFVTEENKFAVIARQLEIEGVKPPEGDDPKAGGSAGS